jgi:hypothetical protein
MTTYIAYLFNTRLGELQGRTYQSHLTKLKRNTKVNSITIRTKYTL